MDSLFSIHFVSFWGLCTALGIIRTCQRTAKIRGVDPPVTWHTVSLVLFNQWALTLPAMLLFAKCFQGPVFYFGNPLSTFIGFVVTEEVLFYTLHRIFHSCPVLYSRIHAYHHRWTVPVPMVALASHPVEHLLTNLVPVFCGPLLFATQWWQIQVWTLLATVNSVWSHSEYSLTGFEKRHILHHQKRIGNYGVLGIMDYLCDTEL